MKLRIWKLVASLLLAGAAVVLAYVAIALGRAPDRQTTERAASLTGQADAVPGGIARAGERLSGRTSSGAFLRALAAERAAVKISPFKHQAESNSAFAAADALARAALATQLTAAQRSQTLNLLAVDELGEANADFGNEQSYHDRAAWNLQMAVLTDPSNNDAKYNLEALVSQDPQATKKQPKKPQGSTAHKPKPKPQHGKKGKGKRGADLTLGNGY